VVKDPKTITNDKGKTIKLGKSSVHILFLDHDRSLTMITVCLAILAVDFPPIFPRTMCKTEEFGISLMDVGVALVTLNSGIAGNKARPWFKHQNKQSFAMELVSSGQNMVVTFLFGFGRFFLMQNIEY